MFCVCVRTRCSSSIVTLNPQCCHEMGAPCYVYIGEDTASHGAVCVWTWAVAVIVVLRPTGMTVSNVFRALYSLHKGKRKKIINLYYSLENNLAHSTQQLFDLWSEPVFSCLMTVCHWVENQECYNKLTHFGSSCEWKVCSFDYERSVFGGGVRSFP